MSFHSAGHTARKFGARRRLLCSASIVALILSPLPALAQATWVSSSGNWSTNTNWSPTASPVNGNSVAFAAVGGTSNDDIAGLSLSSLNLTNYTGTLTLSQNLTVTGATTITAGSTLVNTAAFTGAISNAGNFNNGTTGTVSGLLTNTAGTTTNFGQLNGGASITGGTLALLTAGTITGSVADNATFDISQTTSGASITSLSGSISGVVALGSKTLTLSAASDTFFGAIQDGGLSGATGGALTVTGGTETLAGANTYTGVTTISGGTLALSGSGSIATSSGVVDNATFDISGTTSGASIILLTGSGTVNLGAQTLTITSGSGTFSGNINSSGGGLTISGGTTVTLSGNNSYSGATTLANGVTLKAGSATAFSASSAFVITGLLDLNGNSNSILSLAGAGTVTDSNATGDTLTIAGGSLATPFSGVIQDGAGQTTLTVQGALALSGASANSYTGVTTISVGGKLALTGAGAIPNSSSVSNFGTFDVSGITPGSTASIMTLSGNNSAIVAIGGNTLSLSNASSFYSGSITGTSISQFKIAGGTENFTGNASAFAGTINIASGAFLALGTGATLGSGGITDTGFLTLNAGSGTTTLSNAISGAGQIIQGGAATYILTGANSYTTTTINAGTLQIGNGGTSGSLGSGTVTFGGAATLIFNLSGNVTVANLITGGAGSLTQAGSGTLILTNTNSYGATTINSGGTIQVGGGGTTGTLGSGTVTDNGSLIFNKTSISTFSSSISGTGSLTQAGTGLLNLSNASTYSGATTINPGTTLQLGDGGSIASSSGLTDNGVFDISVTIASSSTIKSLAGSGSVTMGTGAFPKSLTITAGAGTFTGVISGGGAVTISGGTETFNSAQTYTGGTTIASGASLVLGASGSLAGSTVDNGTLGYGATGTTTITSFAGITGSGGIAEVGGGTLIVNTQSPLTGTSAVTSGILIVGDINNPTASLGGGVLVGSLGTLEGHGTVKGAVTVISGGTVKAGASIGTLAVTGTVALPAGTTFIEEFSNTAGSKLAATGAVTLGGALKLVSDSTTYTSGTDYQFITGSSVSSTFSSVTGSPSGYTSTIQYSATAVDLILNPVATTPAAAASAATPAVITTFLFNTYGKTPNQIAAGSALTASAFNAPLYVAVGNVVTANTAAVPTTLGQLAGDIHPSLRSAVIEDARMVRDTMLGHMNRDPDGPILWAAGFGNFGNISDSNAANLGHRSGGFLVGGDLPVAATGNDLRLGLSGGYSTDNASTSGHLSTANGNEGHVGAYVTYTADAVHFYLGDDYGFGSVNIARAVSTLGAVLTDSQSQHSNQLFGELGYRVSWDIPLEPYLGIANVSSGQGAFTEAGGIAALSGASASDSEAFTTLGLRSDLGDPMSWGDASVTPHIDLGWQHALQKLTPSQLVTFQSTGQSFLVLGVPLSRDAAKVKAGIEVNQGPVKLFLDYDGEFASRVSENGISGGIDWQF